MSNDIKTAPAPQSQEEKIPGPLARTYMRLQALNSLVSAVFVAVFTFKTVRKGELTSPTKDAALSNISSFLEPRFSGKAGNFLSSAINMSKEKLPDNPFAFNIDISSPVKRSAAMAGGAIMVTYMALNSIARLRTAKDAATRKQISLGELEPESAILKSGRLDRVLTKIEASISTATALGSLGYAVYASTDKNPDRPKPISVKFALVNSVAAGIMSVVKFRAANAAAKSAQEREASQLAAPPSENDTAVDYVQSAPATSGRAR